MTTNVEEIAVKMVLDAWRSKVNQFEKFLAEVSDEKMLTEVSPGRNRGIYILGHLVALIDHARVLIAPGNELAAPQLMKLFVQTPDNKSNDYPSLPELRQEWEKEKTALAESIAALTPEEWFQKHTSISDADFAKEPHRNRLNVMLSRASHLDYHLGQLVFLKNRG